MRKCHVVLDTNILVSALISKFGNPSKIYKMFLSGEITLVISDDIIIEYTDVLYRSHLKIFADDANIVLDAIKNNGMRVELVSSTFVMTDESDRIFYDTAKNTGAYLITGNTRHYPIEPFICTPAEFYEHII